MPKLKRLTTYMGHLLEPYYRHMQKVELVVSPYDSKSKGICKFFHNSLNNIRPIMKPPNYTYKCTVDHSAKNSYLKVKYQNQWDCVYDLSEYGQREFMENLKSYQTFVDGDCAIQNLEVTYPPEAKMIVSKK